MRQSQTFCTIITADYFFYAKAIYDSLENDTPNINFKVLIVDDYSIDLNYKAIEIFPLIELQQNLASEYQQIKKYEDDKKSNLRWALKPLFLKFLIKIKAFEKVIFIDPDMCFYQNTTFLFEALDMSDVLITPHWRSKDPGKDPTNFNSLFTGGLFNAGFFGCNSNSINILDWWLSVCAYKMEKADGFYVDQVYLNLMPIYFSSQVKILEHNGCNVSNWNMIECERTKKDETVLINNKYPVVFIHFTNATINIIAHGKDKLLQPFLNVYKANLLQHNSSFKFAYETEKPIVENKLKLRLKKIYKRFSNE